MKRTVLFCFYIIFYSHPAFSQEYPITSMDPFTLRREVPSTFEASAISYNTDAWEEWTYWKRKGPYTWDVEFKSNFRMMRPNNYDSLRDEGYPLIIHLSGCGETGRYRCGGSAITSTWYDNNILQLGYNERWIGETHRDAVQSNEFPGFVVAPQADFPGWENGYTNDASKEMKKVHDLIEYFSQQFNIEKNKIFIHGFSNGGKGVWDCINRRPDLFAGALPMSAIGNESMFGQLGHLPIWLFQGERDSNPPVAGARSLNLHFNDYNGGNLRYHEYAGVGHGTWYTPYAYSEPDFYTWMLAQDQRNIHVFYGETDLTASDGDILLGIAPGHLAYEWFDGNTILPNETSNQLTVDTPGNYKVRFQRYDGSWTESFTTTITGSGNVPPAVSAGEDQSITLPTNDITITGTATDADGTIASTIWRQVTGPITTIGDATLLDLGLSQLEKGFYTFELEATDDLGAIAKDQVSLTVIDPTPNDAPIVDAGSDMVIQLPSNELVLPAMVSDSDGTIALISWEQVSGPTMTLSNTDQAALTITNLVEGVSSFRITAEDDDFASNSDEVIVSIIAAGGGDAGAPIYRINCGGGEISDTPMAWTADTKSEKHVYLTSSSANAITGYTYNFSGNSTEAANEVFGTQRYLPSWGNELSYEFPVDNGTYTVKLFFAEKQGSTTQAGERIQAIDVEGNRALDQFDVVAEAGLGSLQKNLITTVGDGFLSLDFVKIQGTPFISAIEIYSGSANLGQQNAAPIADAGSDQIIALPTSSLTIFGIGSDSDGVIASYAWSKLDGPAVTIAALNEANLELSDLEVGTYEFELTVTDDDGETSSDQMKVTVFPEPPEGGQGTIIYRINAGGSELEDDPLVWSVDTKSAPSPYLSHLSANATTGWNYDVSGNTTTAPNVLFGTNRYGPSWGGNVLYAFPVENSTYDIKMFFAEKPFSNTLAGDRKFAVEIEGIRVLDNFDIAAEVGNGTVQHGFQVLVSDGEINIELIRQVNVPIISGIEISSLVQVAPAPVYEVFEGEIEGGISQGASIYPNPFSNELTLDFLVGEEDKSLGFVMRNLAGQIIRENSYEIESGQYSIELDFSTENIAPGMYMIWLTTESYPNQFAKVIKK